MLEKVRSGLAGQNAAGSSRFSAAVGLAESLAGDLAGNLAKAPAGGLSARTTPIRPPLRWMWGEALLVYAMAELGAYLSPGDPESSPCFAFATAACDAWAASEQRVDQSDTAAPALALHAVQSRVGGHVYDPLLAKVLRYLREEPRLVGDIPNHLGHSPEGHFYPKSVWVDSMMMLGLFPALRGRREGDAELLDRAARLPGQFSSLLQDAESGLWRHSWWKGGQGAPASLLISRGPFPARPIFWARGNGWVIRSLSLILDCLPPGHREYAGILRIFRETSAALLGVQRPDRWFGTVLGRPTYRESSATLLVAGGWMRGLARGWLDEAYRVPAIAAFESVADTIRPGRRGGSPELPEISGPTIPLPLFPFLGYALLPRGRNLPYGLAALILAALDYEGLVR
jgi:unsaturated rhamnogalacturonyl hydrolase